MEIPALGTVLCPVDLSAHSKAALYLAVGLSQHDTSRLVVLRVHGGDREKAREELEAFVESSLPSWPEGVHLDVRDGTPADAVLSAAREAGADMIVLGTRGHGALSRAVLGSTTRTLLRESPVPVVVVPPSGTEIIALQPGSATPHLGVLLVPVDLTAASMRQLEWAARLSAASSHRILMLHAIATADGEDAALERMSAAARDVASPREFRLLVRTGPAAEEVLKVAKDRLIGLVVLGRSSDEPGKLAYELLRQNRAVVAMVP